MITCVGFRNTTLRLSWFHRKISRQISTSKFPCLWRLTSYKAAIKKSSNSSRMYPRSRTTFSSKNSLMLSGMRSHVAPSAAMIVYASETCKQCLWSTIKRSWCLLSPRTNNKQHLGHSASRSRGRSVAIDFTLSRLVKRSPRYHQLKWSTYLSSTPPN